MPSRNYTLTRVTSGEQDLEWDTSASKYVLSSLLVKPEKLYAYTKTIKSKSYYGWGALNEGGAAYYTTSPTPQENDILYVGKGNYYPTYTDDPSDLRHAEFEPVANSAYSVESDFSAIRDANTRTTRERCIEADTTLPDRYDTIWVNDTTLTPGMVIYDNTGTYTDYRVQDVYAEGFELETVTITFTAYTKFGPGESAGYKGIVNGISFDSSWDGNFPTPIPSTFKVPKGKVCTIAGTHNGAKGNTVVLATTTEEILATGDYAFVYTFTPTEDCTFQIGASGAK